MNMKPILHCAALLLIAMAVPAVEIGVPGQHPTIQAALDAAAPGDTISVAPGTYRERLTVRVPVTLRGVEAQKASIEWNATDGPIVQAQGIDGLQLQGLRIYMAGSRDLPEDADRHAGVYLAGGKAVMTDCLLEDNASNGVLLTGGGTLMATGCTFLWNGREGVSVLGAESAATFSECLFKENGTVGVAADAAKSLVVKQSKAISNGYDGIIALNTALDVRDSVAEGNGGSGIGVLDCPAAVVTGVTSDKNGGAGIFIQGSGAQQEFRGNTCRSNRHSGIFTDTGARPLIEDNECSGNNEAGIMAGHAETSPEIKGNRCENNRADGILIVQGASARISRNSCTGNTAAGIAVAGFESNANIEGNVCRGNGMAGITVANYASARVAENECEENAGAGISLADHAHLDALSNRLANNAKGDTSELQEPTRAIRPYLDEYAWCYRTGRFDRLERLRAHYVATGVRDNSGDPLLEALYRGFMYDLGRFKFPSEEEEFSRIEEWRVAVPRSGAAALVKFLALSRAAWNKRDGDFANEVSEAGWKGFNEGLKKAHEYLKSIESGDFDFDAQYRVARVNFATDSSGEYRDPRTEFLAGVAKHPDYVPLYRAFARSVSPYWNGDQAKLEAFLHEVPRLAGEEHAAAAYAASVNALIRNGALSGFLEREYTYDSELAEKAFEQEISLWTRNLTDRNALAVVLCGERDQARAKAVFDTIGDNPSLSIWEDEEKYALYRAWANGTGDWPASMVDDSEGASESLLDQGTKRVRRALLGNLFLPLAGAATLVVIVSVVIGGYFALKAVRGR